VSVLEAGPLGQAGGVAVVPGLPDPYTSNALAHEATGAYAGSTRQVCDVNGGGDGRGGTPRRALHTAAGDAVQDALYAAPWLRALLSEQCGAPVRPTGSRGSYSYYVQPGDFLDTHLDIDECDVTLITVLHDSTPPDSPAGGLAVYRDEFSAPLSRIRANPESGAALVKAKPGESIILLGGLVPHRVVPIGESGQRVISALCFRAYG
jgi:hypothetical protein